MNSSEFLSEYSDLVLILSQKYKFSCDSGIFYGTNLLTNKKYPLARRRENSRKFVADEGVKGHILIEYVCEKFNSKGLDITPKLARFPSRSMCRRQK